MKNVSGLHISPTKESEYRIQATSEISKNVTKQLFWSTSVQKDSEHTGAREI